MSLYLKGLPARAWSEPRIEREQIDDTMGVIRAWLEIKRYRCVYRTSMIVLLEWATLRKWDCDWREIGRAALMKQIMETDKGIMPYVGGIYDED